MVTGIANAISGYQNAAKRIEVSAANIANQFATVKPKGEENSGEPYTPLAVVSISQQEGGVDSEVVPREPATLRQYDPANPNADENGVATLPNVDLAEELVNQAIASYDAKANLKVIKIENEILQSTLDIFT